MDLSGMEYEFILNFCLYLLLYIDLLLYVAHILAGVHVLETRHRERSIDIDGMRVVIFSPFGPHLSVFRQHDAYEVGNWSWSPLELNAALSLPAHRGKEREREVWEREREREREKESQSSQCALRCGVNVVSDQRQHIVTGIRSRLWLTREQRDVERRGRVQAEGRSSPGRWAIFFFRIPPPCAETTERRVRATFVTHSSDVPPVDRDLISKGDLSPEF